MTNETAVPTEVLPRSHWVKEGDSSFVLVVDWHERAFVAVNRRGGVSSVEIDGRVLEPGEVREISNAAQVQERIGVRGELPVVSGREKERLEERERRKRRDFRGDALPETYWQCLDTMDIRLVHKGELAGSVRICKPVVEFWAGSRNGSTFGSDVAGMKMVERRLGMKHDVPCLTEEHFARIARAKRERERKQERARVEGFRLRYKRHQLYELMEAKGWRVVEKGEPWRAEHDIDGEKIAWTMISRRYERRETQAKDDFARAAFLEGTKGWRARLEALRKAARQMIENRRRGRGM